MYYVATNHSFYILYIAFPFSVQHKLAKPKPKPRALVELRKERAQKHTHARVLIGFPGASRVTGNLDQTRPDQTFLLSCVQVKPATMMLQFYLCIR